MQTSTQTNKQKHKTPQNKTKNKTKRKPNQNNNKNTRPKKATTKKQTKNLNQPQHGAGVPRNRHGSVKWGHEHPYLRGWRMGRYWLCKTWITAVEKKWSVRWEDRSKGDGMTGSIKSPSTSHGELPAVLQKTIKINFLSSALTAEIWEGKLSFCSSDPVM